MPNQVIEWRGKPKALRCDNGPEYISATLTAWAKKHDIRVEYIQPGKPQQNAYIERYNRTVRYDWLGQHLFESIKQVQTFGGVTQRRDLPQILTPFRSIRGAIILTICKSYMTRKTEKFTLTGFFC